MKFLKTTLFLCIATSMFSCRVAYFKKSAQVENAVQNTEAVIKSGDILSIIVSAEDQAVAQQFNLPMSSSATYGELKAGASGGTQLQPYIVETDGSVNMPVLGKVEIAEKTRPQAVAFLQEKLAAYVNKPIVTIQFINYKVTILGEVAKPGTYTIPDEKITLTQALGLAGDLTIYGKRGNVLLVREKPDGQKEFTRIDLHKQDILFSENYYLRQNDVIYVQPNGTKVFSANAAIITIPLSIVSGAASIATLIYVTIPKDESQ
ncbi:MAG: polysaccharide biosynthesis/export family protein [Prevotellaceae bacterium]|jgi:polysaccharide export outer membrane protein|nr:polysaccharide biosynthesis/export family protein [Prevotellaceae bacterium]